MLRQPQRVLGMDADKGGLAVVQIVGTLAKVEIQDVDAVHLLHINIVTTLADMLSDGLGYAIEHTLEIVKLAALLYLNKDNLTLGVLGLDVNAIELVILVLLVRLALQQLHDGHLLTDKDGNKTLEDGEVGLIAKHVLRSPVKSDVFVLFHFATCWCLQRYKQISEPPNDSEIILLISIQL